MSNAESIQILTRTARALYDAGEIKSSIEVFKVIASSYPNFFFGNGLHVEAAHKVFLGMDWQLVNSFLPKGTNFADESGWTRSITEGRPVNKDGKPIPWFSYPAIEFIESKVKVDSKVLEFGSGFSTLWWGDRVSEIVSVENDKHWFDLIQQQVGHNVRLELREEEEDYSGICEEYPNLYFDIIVIDGSYRSECVRKSVLKLRQDGFIVFDNSDRAEYSDAIQSLDSLGFARVDFIGPMPCYLYKNCTSIFFQEKNLFMHSEGPSSKSSCLGMTCAQALEMARDKDSR